MGDEAKDIVVDIDKNKTSARDFLNDDSDDKPEDKPEEAEEDKEEEEEEEDEDDDSHVEDETEEDETDAIADEDDEEDEPVKEVGSGLPTFKAIKAKYPKFLTDFPEVGTAYREYKAIVQIVPTIDEIKHNKEQAETLDFLSDSLVKGDVTTFLKATKEQGALELFAKKILPSLSDLDKSAFETAVNPLLKDLIRKFRAYGERAKDNNVINSSKLLTHFLYGELDLSPEAETKEDPNLKRKLDELTIKERAIETRETDRFVKGLEVSTRKRIIAIIEEHLPKDPEEALSGLFKDFIIKKVLDNYSEIMTSDNQHMAIMRRLMQEARRSNFDDNSKIKMVKQYLTRSKILLPKLTAKYMAELKSKGKKVVTKKDEGNMPEDKTSGRKKELDKRKPLREQMTAREFLDT